MRRTYNCYAMGNYLNIRARWRNHHGRLKRIPVLCDKRPSHSHCPSTKFGLLIELKSQWTCTGSWSVGWAHGIGLGLETELIAGSVELALFAGCRLLITGGLVFLVAWSCEKSIPAEPPLPSNGTQGTPLVSAGPSTTARQFVVTRSTTIDGCDNPAIVNQRIEFL